MKKFLLAAFFALTLSITLTFAHELLPKEIQDYITTHPNATVEELQAFMNEKTPQFASKYKTAEQVLQLLQNQNTSVFDNAGDFIKLGVGHILSGADHILFVLSLLLVFLGIRQMLRLTITFTIAHSITLVLAGTGILVLSPRIVEPFIAFSIAYTALTSVFLKKYRFFSDPKNKIGAVFFFGLFHGLGFAGLLKEIRIPEDKFLSSLLSFNVGIELGQILIVTLALPFIYFGYKKAWYPREVQILAVLMGGVGMTWGIQRILFSV